MKRICVLIIAMALLFSACGTKDIEVSEAWARPAMQGKNSAVYFQVSNRTPKDDELTGVSSDIADMVEFHESKMENDVMTMNMFESIPLASGEKLIFEPGGLHIMLTGVKQELKAGDQFDLVVHFQNHEDMTIHVVVKENGE